MRGRGAAKHHGDTDMRHPSSSSSVGGGRGGRGRGRGRGGGGRGAGGRSNSPHPTPQTGVVTAVAGSVGGQKQGGVGGGGSWGPPMPQNQSQLVAGDLVSKAKRSLEQVEEIVQFMSTPNHRNSATSYRLKDLQTSLDLDLFNVGTGSSRITPIQELRIQDAVCSFFKKVYEKDRRNSYAYFNTLFLGREGESVPHETRIGFLIKLTQLAVQYDGCEPLFEDIAMWLQKIGLAKKYAQQIVYNLVDNFCDYPEVIGGENENVNPENEIMDTGESSGNGHCQSSAAALSTAIPEFYFYPMALLETAPSFSPYFMALAVQKYSADQIPPLFLIQLLATWMDVDPQPLIRQAVDSLSQQHAVTSAAAKSSKERKEAESKLHAGLLNLMIAYGHSMTLKAPRKSSDSSSVEIFPILADTLMCGWLKKIHDTLLPAIGGGGRQAANDATANNHKNYRLAMDRFSQALQVSIASFCFHGSKQKVIQTYREVVLAAAAPPQQNPNDQQREPPTQPFKHPLIEYISELGD